MITIDGVVKRFGGVRAVEGVSLALEPGRITGLVGPNGAGKSTLFACISGELVPDAGSVRLAVEDVTALAPQERANLGLARTFQVPAVFPSLTVRQCLMAAVRGEAGEHLLSALFRPSAVRRSEARLSAAADRMIDTVGLSAVADLPTDRLSGGQRKLLELGRALIAEPRALLLDEIGAGVAPARRTELAAAIGRLAAEREVTVLLIEHDLRLVAQLCSHVVVMADGRIIAEGTMAELGRDPKVVSAYFGDRTEAAA